MTLPIAADVVPLWDGPAPQSHGSAPTDIPSLTVFLPAKTDRPTSAIIIFPGGAYEFLAFEHEGTNNAKYFQAHGVAAFVLKYRLPKNGYHHPVPLLDAQRAIRLVRSQASLWNIDPAKVGIMGFSAGGHLAATLDTHFDTGTASVHVEGQPTDTSQNPPTLPTSDIDKISCRPDFAVLVYPVITLKDGITHAGSKANLLGPNPDPALVTNLSNETQVTPNTPPTLLVHAADDDAVPIENSRLMLAALQKNGVACELQEYPHGKHGFGYFPEPEKNRVPGWLDHAYAWLKAQGFVP